MSKLIYDEAEELVICVCICGDGEYCSSGQATASMSSATARRNAGFKTEVLELKVDAVNLLHKGILV